jgi:hypothetical protein
MDYMKLVEQKRYCVLYRLGCKSGGGKVGTWRKSVVFDRYEAAAATAEELALSSPGTAVVLGGGCVAGGAAVNAGALSAGDTAWIESFGGEDMRQLAACGAEAAVAMARDFVESIGRL